MTGEIIPELTHDVSRGTLNPTMPYGTRCAGEVYVTCVLFSHGTRCAGEVILPVCCLAMARGVQVRLSYLCVV